MTGYAHRPSSKRRRQLDREIAEALAAYRSRTPSTRRHHSTALGSSATEAESPSQRPPTSDELYMIAYDVLREYEPYKKLKQEKVPEAQELIKRFHRINKEIRRAHPDATPPAQFKKLYDKLTKPDKTYTEAQRDILQNLAANGWQVSPGLKIPHATSPNGQLRLWFKPQAVWFTKTKPGERSQHGGTHNFKDARTVSYNLDTRTQDPDTFRESMRQWSEKSES